MTGAKRRGISQIYWVSTSREVLASSAVAGRARPCTARRVSVWCRVPGQSRRPFSDSTRLVERAKRHEHQTCLKSGRSGQIAVQSSWLAPRGSMARVSRGATSTNGRRIASSQIDGPCQRWARVALPVVAEYTTGPGVTCRSTRYMLEKLALRGL